jgi:hypothetical protein
MIPYLLYLSGIELENNFVVMKREQTTSCILKLYTIKSPFFLVQSINCLKLFPFPSQFVTRENIFADQKK